MSEADKPPVGSIGWLDLTVPNAEEVRDFYTEVIGWSAAPVDMGDYNDFNMMLPGNEEPTAGVCHARGDNADLPPVWMVYIVVADADASAARCKELGGEVLAGPRGEKSRYCVIKDPAGAVLALFQPG